MAGNLFATALLLAAVLATAAGTRSLAPAGAPANAVDVAGVGAPGPSSSGLPAADILFTISARRARLTANELTLSGVADTAVWTTRQSVAGIDSTATFANTSEGSMMVARNGKWLGDPAAVMFAANGSALLQLSNPEYDAEKRRLTFESKILSPTSAAALTTSRGVSARYVADVAGGDALDALTAPPAGGLDSVALFIEQAEQDLGSEATTEWWRVFWHRAWGWRVW